jgi:hypothetical protein
VNVENRGMLLRSNPFTWADGAMVDVDRNFLREAQGKMRAPVIRELLFHAQLQVTGVTATLLAKDACKVFNRIQVADRGGYLFDCSGSTARIIEQMELGDKFEEPNGGVALASAATSAVYDVWSRVIFDTERAHRGADTGLPLNHLFDGGRIAFRGGTPPGCTMTGATVRVYADVHDEREAEAKSRQVWKEFAITKAEDNYTIGGSLRAAFLTSNLATTGYTALSTQVATVTSKTLAMSDIDFNVLRQQYRRLAKDRSSVDAFLNSLTAPDAVALRVPSSGQHIGKLEDLNTLHLKLVTAPTGGVFVSCVIEDRNADLAAETLGFETVNDMLHAVSKQGRVGAKGKSDKSATGWNPRLVRRLPIVLSSEE